MENMVISDEGELIDVLRSVGPNSKMRQIYLARGNSWRYTYSGSYGDGVSRAIAPQTVTALVVAGVLNRVYSDTGDAYWLGATLDVDATMKERQKHGARHAMIYVAPSPPHLAR